MVSELNGLHMVCLLKGVTPGCVTKTVAYSLENDYLRFCDLFAILLAKVKRVFSAGPASPPRTLNKQYSVRIGLAKVYCMYFTYG